MGVSSTAELTSCAPPPNKLPSSKHTPLDGAQSRLKLNHGFVLPLSQRVRSASLDPPLCRTLRSRPTPPPRPSGAMPARRLSATVSPDEVTAYQRERNRKKQKAYKDRQREPGSQSSRPPAVTEPTPQAHKPAPHPQRLHRESLAPCPHNKASRPLGKPRRFVGALAPGLAGEAEGGS